MSDEVPFSEFEDFTGIETVSHSALKRRLKKVFVEDYGYSEKSKSKEHVIAVEYPETRVFEFKGLPVYYVDSSGKDVTKDIKKVAVYDNYEDALDGALKFCNYDLEDLKDSEITFKIIPIEKLYESKKPNDLVEKFIEHSFPRSNFEEEVQRRKNAVNDAICELAEMIDCNEVVKFTQDVLNLYCR